MVPWTVCNAEEVIPHPDLLFLSFAVSASVSSESSFQLVYLPEVAVVVRRLDIVWIGSGGPRHRVLEKITLTQGSYHTYNSVNEVGIIRHHRIGESHIHMQGNE